jgi:PHD/YefM family antitoxin component YafN of YafNO toxin-antitoxin module
MDQMSPEEFRQNLDALLSEEYFPPVAVMYDGKPRLVVLPIEAFRSMHRASRKVVRVEDMTEQDIEEIANSKMPEGLEHLNDLLKED